MVVGELDGVLTKSGRGGGLLCPRPQTNSTIYYRYIIWPYCLLLLYDYDILCHVLGI